MDKQFQIYSLDTKAFYTKNEINLNLRKFYAKQKVESYEKWQEYNINSGNNISYKEFSDNIFKVRRLERKLTKMRMNGKCDEIIEKEIRDEIKRLNSQYKIKINNTKDESDNFCTLQEQKFMKELKSISSTKILNKDAKKVLKDNEEYIQAKAKYNELNKKFNDIIAENPKLKRRVNENKFKDINLISLFENSISRTMGIKENTICKDIIVVRAYHYPILEQLINNGFRANDEYGNIVNYRVFTSSAGQIRTKKILFIKEDAWDKYEKTFMCGLTIESINNSSEKGCNINKFLAYLALSSSATDEIENFDIDKCIVIDDFETNVNGKVDYIDNKTFEITRKVMDIPIPHSDGCGWVNPKVSKKNFMIRLPWVKGLMTPVDYIKFCNTYNNKKYTVIDIYGKEWDLKKDGIDYVFTKSQFKMYKYYPNILDSDNNILEYGWDTYKNAFKKYNCKGNMCNLEPDTKEFRKASFNYQMWQTLTDITDDEIKYFTTPVEKYISDGYSDRKTMLKMLGADSDNLNKNWKQKCLEIYPELLRDYHFKDELGSTLNARKKEAKYGKFKINATYTFLIPDVYAWMQNVFLKEEVPQGLLQDGEVYCKLYKDKNKLLVERSPHLYREHCCRNNVNGAMYKEWYLTDGIYTSSHDLISKILQFDVDGDKALVISDEKLYEIAERNMKGIVPLYYEMGKANALTISKAHIYESLTKAFKFNNIGKFSNQLTVMWNLDNTDLETMAQITALNNFTIDGAKTLLVPEVPSDVEKKMKVANGKLPYFFQFAKDKSKSDVAEMNNSTVNRICKNIENIPTQNFVYNGIAKFKKDKLMKNKKVEIDNCIVNKYNEMCTFKANYVKKLKVIGEEFRNDKYLLAIQSELDMFLNKNNYTIEQFTDVVIQYIYTHNSSCVKTMLFDLCGEQIYKNLKDNLRKQCLTKGYIMCDICGKRVLSTSNRTLYCERCAKIIKRENDIERIQEYRKC